MSSTTSLQQIASKFLAQALTEVFPGCFLIEGAYSNILFHYDAILPQKIDASMLCLVEEKMRGLIKSRPELRVTEMMPRNAAEYFRCHGQPVIAEQMEEIDDPLVAIVQLGDFKDFCDPEEIPEVLDLFFFELLNLDVQHIDGEWVTHFTGSAHFEKETLKAFVKRFRAARKFDHRSLGQHLKLFTSLNREQLAWLPRGEQLKKALLRLNLKSIPAQPPLDFQPELLGMNPKRTFDPTAVWHAWLYAQAGESMLRLSGLEQKIDPAKPSQFCGMLRNRQYTIATTHLFCPPGLALKELIYSLQLLDKIIKIFGFEVQWQLRAKRPHSAVNGSEWDAGVKALTQAAQTVGLKVALVDAQGALIGPKLEALFQDALGQIWSGSFIQIDCCHPRLMKLAYEGKEHQAHTPKMIALSAWGSLERMVALMIENHQGLLQWPNFLTEVDQKINGINEESISPIES